MSTAKRILTVADEVDRLGRRRAELVGQWVVFQGRKQRVRWTRWTPDDELEVSFEATGGAYFLASKMTLAGPWKPLIRKRLDTFMRSGLPTPDPSAANRDATLADLRRGLKMDRDATAKDIATAGDVGRALSRAPDASARHTTPNAKGANPCQGQPPSLCDSVPVQTVPSPD